MKEYIKENINKSNERLLYNRIVTYIKDPLPEDFDLDYVFSKVQKTIPEHITYEID